MSLTPTMTCRRDGAVFVITLSRPAEYNTINAAFRDDLAAALDEAEADQAVRVILLNAEGNAFCAGYDLKSYTARQALGETDGRVWDSMSDYHFISSYVRVFQRLWYSTKPTIAAVQGWCVAGGTDLVLWTDMIIAARTASFGYPPSRVWGVPTNPLWAHRIGFENAKRYLLTGDEIPAVRAHELGLVHELVDDNELPAASMALAQRVARLPLNQLEMIKMFCNHQAEHMGLQTTRLLGILFDGVARHTQEGMDFVARFESAGFRQAVAERDAPFGDYGSRGHRRSRASADGA